MAFALRTAGGGSSGVGDWGGGWLCRNEIQSCWVYFDLYVYKDVRYLKVNQPGSKWDGFYLSVNKNGYLGVYRWSGASGWALNSDSQLVSQYNGQPVRVETSTQANYLKACASDSSDLQVTYFERKYNPDLYTALA